jgi:hypothetical protein
MLAGRKTLDTLNNSLITNLSEEEDPDGHWTTSEMETGHLLA